MIYISPQLEEVVKNCYYLLLSCTCIDMGELVSDLIMTDFGVCQFSMTSVSFLSAQHLRINPQKDKFYSYFFPRTD